MCSAIQPSMRPRYDPSRKRQALLPQQHVAAVVGADRDDRVVLREMGDEAALGINVEHAVQALGELAVRRRVDPTRSGPCAS